MKRLSCALLCYAIAAGVSLASGTSGNGSVKPFSSTEVFTSKITHVFQFQEGDLDYVAYVVTWHDHDVVVQPFALPNQEKHHVVGDIIRCSVHETYLRGLDGRIASHVVFAAMSNSPAHVASSTPVQPTLPAHDRLWESLDAGPDRIPDQGKVFREDPRAQPPQQPVKTMP